jgi:hypothetical protein
LRVLPLGFRPQCLRPLRRTCRRGPLCIEPLPNRTGIHKACHENHLRRGRTPAPGV